MPKPDKGKEPLKLVFSTRMHSDIEAMMLQNDLEQISRFYRLVEGSLEKELAEFVQRIDKQAQELPDAARQEYYEWQSDGHWEFNEVFPGLFRSSLFLSCYALLEARLDRLCDIAKTKDGHVVALDDIKGRGIRRARIYLEKVCCVPVPTRQWDNLMLLNAMRNTLIHSEGRIPADGIGKEIHKFAASNPNLLRVDGAGRIALQEGFLPYSLSIISSFFDDLYEPLRWKQDPASQ